MTVGFQNYNYSVPSSVYSGYSTPNFQGGYIPASTGYAYDTVDLSQTGQTQEKKGSTLKTVGGLALAGLTVAAFVKGKGTKGIFKRLGVGAKALWNDAAKFVGKLFGKNKPAGTEAMQTAGKKVADTAKAIKSAPIVANMDTLTKNYTDAIKEMGEQAMKETIEATKYSPITTPKFDLSKITINMPKTK